MIFNSIQNTIAGITKKNPRFSKKKNLVLGSLEIKSFVIRAYKSYKVVIISKYICFKKVVHLIVWLVNDF